MAAIYRFCRDLRLEDHAGLAAAAAFGPIIPVLIVDRELEDRLRRSPRRAAFFCGAARALDAALRSRGAGLIVRYGDPVRTLSVLVNETGARTVAWSLPYDRTGMATGERLRLQLEENGVRCIAAHDAPAIAPEETSAARSAGGGYRAFAPYYERWRAATPPSFEGPLLLSFTAGEIAGSPLPEPGKFGSDCREPECGSPHALTKFRAFLADGAGDYAFAINLPADDRTSQLGADLSFGTIAARTVVRETKERAQDPFLLAEERSSLRLFLRSLAMRDFFLQLSWYHPQTDVEPLQEKMRSFPWNDDHPRLEAWRTGQTGYPLVDAGIGELRAAGRMHPRVRAAAASFLCFDLGVDWRAGAAAWDRELIEDDPALAVGNWQWIAGVGADLAAYPRIYNPQRQLRRFDPDGRYVRKWIPELAHRAASAAASRQIDLPLYSGGIYARPIVEHDRAAREFLRRYREFTRSSGHPANR